MHGKGARTAHPSYAAVQSGSNAAASRWRLLGQGTAPERPGPDVAPLCHIRRILNPEGNHVHWEEMRGCLEERLAGKTAKRP